MYLILFLANTKQTNLALFSVGDKELVQYCRETPDKGRPNFIYLVLPTSSSGNKILCISHHFHLHELLYLHYLVFSVHDLSITEMMLELTLLVSCSNNYNVQI